MSVWFYWESPGKFDSRTLSRETLSRWTGCTSCDNLLISGAEYIYIYMHLYIYIYIYIHTYTYIYIYIHMPEPRPGATSRSCTTWGRGGRGSKKHPSFELYVYLRSVLNVYLRTIWIFMSMLKQFWYVCICSTSFECHVHFQPVLMFVSIFNQFWTLCFFQTLLLTIPIPWDPISSLLKYFGRLNLYTTTTQRGWCIEVFVSILVQSQSQTSLPGGGGVENLSSHY